MLSDPCTLASLRRHHLFDRLPEQAFLEVCNLANLRRLETNDCLFHQGVQAERFYVLLEGQVKLIRTLPEGQEKLVEVIQSGQSFAEALMFSGVQSYPVTAIAMRASNLLSIDATHFRFLLEDQPKICLDLLASFSIRLHQRLNEIDTLTLANASRRVVRYLSQASLDANGDIQLGVSKRLIASQLGIQPETFSRILHRLVDAGLIAMQQRRIQIIDRPNLMDFCD